MNVNNEYIQNGNGFEFDRTDFTEQEVRKVCTDIDTSKSASIPDVKTMVLKHAFLGNIDKLTKLFNNSLSYSMFPQQLKLSTIIPLPKVPLPKSASDLRPVALTPLPGKLLERLICMRLQNWMGINNILSSCQHGFRKNRSTISAISHFLNDIYNYINEMKNPYIIYLDLKKVVDTISHKKMVHKLRELGLDQNTVSWFNSYLINRQQCIKVNDGISDILPITYGVPQGSILGPILFSIYINEISNIVNCGIVLYADDTVLYHPDKNILQRNLKLVTTWCDANLLTINVKKSHWMKIKVCANDEFLQDLTLNKFCVSNTELTEVKIYKYLGLHIDTNLNFRNHHNKMIAHAQSKLTHFRRIRCLVNEKAAKLIYKCTILPVLEYADFIQDQGIIYINKAIQKLQNYGLSIVYNQHALPYDQRDSSETLHRKINVFRLTHRRRLHLLQFAFRFKDNEGLLDIRDIPTRRHQGVLFMVPKSNY